jgi:hypothetical protein
MLKIIARLLIVVVLFSCKGKENNQESGSKDSLKTESVKTEYTCPMHPEVVSNKPGQCPQCGMDLQAKS